MGSPRLRIAKMSAMLKNVLSESNWDNLSGCSSVVEHLLAKERVVSSNLITRSRRSSLAWTTPGLLIAPRDPVALPPDHFPDLSGTRDS